MNNCEECDGTGLVKTAPCPKCYGTGKKVLFNPIRIREVQQKGRK